MVDAAPGDSDAHTRGTSGRLNKDPLERGREECIVEGERTLSLMWSQHRDVSYLSKVS